MAIDQVSTVMKAQMSLNVMDYSLFGTAIDGLSAKQVALALSTQKLSQAQLEEIIIENDLLAKYGAEELIKTGLLSANSSLLASEKAVSLETLKQSILKNTLNKEKAEDFIQTQLEIISDGEEIASTTILNKTLTDEMVKRGILSEEKANEILKSFGVVSGDVAETASKEGLTAATWKLVKAQAAVLASNPITWAILAGTAIYGVVKAVDYFTVSTEEAMESLEETSQAFEQSTSDLQSLNDELKTTADRISELEKLKDAGRISVAEQDELDRLKEENKELKRNIVLKKQEQIENAKAVLTDLDNADLTVKSKYDTKTVRGKEFGNEVTRAEEAVNAQEEYNNLLSQRNALEEQEAELLQKQKDGTFTTEDKKESVIKQGKRVTVTTEKSDKTKLEEVRKQIEEINGNLEDTDSYIGELYDENAQKKISSYESLIDAGVKLDSTQQADYDSLIALEDAYLMHCYRVQQTEEAYKALNAEQQKSVLLDKLKAKGYTDEQANAVVSSINEYDLDNYYTADFDFTLPNIDDYNGDIQKWASDFAKTWNNHINEEISNETNIQFSDIFSLEDSEGTATALSELKDNIDKVTSSYQALKNALEEYRTTGSLSFSTIESLIESGDDWLNYLSVEDDQLKINEQAYYDMAQAKLYELKVQALQNLSDQVKGLKNIASAQAWIESQNYSTADSYKILTDSIIQETIAELNAKRLSSENDDEKAKWQEAIDLYKQQADKINQLFDSVNISSMLSDSTSTLADSLSNAQTTAKLINTVNEEIEENGKISVSTLQDIASTYPVLEKYVMDYMAGVEGSEAELINQLNELYAQDVNNYKEAWLLKAQDDKTFWVDFQNNAAETVNKFADQYGVDLKNFDSYAQAKIALAEKIQETLAKVLEADYYVTQRTNSTDITKSAEVAGLTTDQKRNAQNLWIKWKNEYLDAKMNGEEYSITQDQMAQILERSGGLNNGSAKQLAQTLYRDLVHLSIDSGRSYYDSLIEESENLESAFSQYSAQYADEVSVAFDSPNKLDSSSSSTDKDTSESFDWIETALEKQSEALDKLKTKADNTYDSWTSRNNALTQAIDKTRESINMQTHAYQRYMQEAESIGLSGYYKKLVQNGAIDISTITDETLKDQISEYQTWYEKAQDCLKTQDDLNNELNELKSQKFTNIKSEYDAVIERMQSAYDLLESQITLLSSSADYNDLRRKQNTIISQLQSERNALQRELNSSGIQQYTEEWYNLVSEVDSLTQQIDDANNTLEEIDSLQFDNIKEAFDFDTSILEHGIQMIQNKVDLLEMKGQFANESYYNGMIQYTQKELDTLMKERTQLQNMLNNTLYKQGTSEWNDMYSTLMDIDEEIDSMTSNLTEFNNAIRDLNWDIFEYLEESINRITDETDYLIELLSKEDLYDKDNGNLTKYADATIALHATAYDTYKQQAQDYYEEVQDLQRQLVNGAGKDVLEQYNEMVEAHRDAVLAAEDEKQSILDLIEDGYNAQLDALQKLIDKKKEQLQIEKNLFDYQKSIKEKTDNISSLEKQQLAYDGDDSEEAISKIQQIKVQLEEAKADLKETEYEQYLQDTETMLDNLSSDYESWMNDRLDHSDALLAEIVGTVSGKGDEINSTLNEVADEYGTMISDTVISIFSTDSPFTTALTNGLYDVSNNTVGAVNSVNSTIGNGFQDTKNSIAGTTTAINNLIEKVSSITSIIQKTNAGANILSSTNGSNSSLNNTSNVTNTGNNTSSSYIPVYTPPISSTSQSNTQSSSSSSDNSNIFIRKVDSYPKSKLQTETSIVDRLKYNNFDSSFTARASYYTKLGGSGTYTGSSAQNTWLLQKMKSMGYRKGTLRATQGLHLYDEDGIGSEVIITKDGILKQFNGGDRVFNKDMVDNLWNLAQLNTPAIKVNLPTLPKMERNNVSNSVNMSVDGVEINLPNVTNYKEFRNELIKDSTFTNAMGTYVNNKIMGKNPLEHLKYAKK